MAAKPVRVAFLADTADLRSSLDRAQASMEDTARTAQKAAGKVDTAFDATAGGADEVASKGAQAAGALSGLGDLIGGKFGTAMMTGGVALQAFADGGDLLNAALENSVVATLRERAATVRATIATKAKTVATRAQTIAQRALNIAMRANPIGLIITGLVLLGAALVLAYKKSETFRNIVNRAFALVKGAASSVVEFVTQRIPEAFNRVLEFFRGIKDRVGRIAGGMWDGITGAFKTAINAIIDIWNGLEFSIPGFDWPGPGSFGGVTIGTPNIPHLAKGGVVTRPTIALIGEAGPEAVVPLGKGLGGNTYYITLAPTPGTSPAEIGRELVRCIDAYEADGGRRRA